MEWKKGYATIPSPLGGWRCCPAWGERKISSLVVVRFARLLCCEPEITEGAVFTGCNQRDVLPGKEGRKFASYLTCRWALICGAARLIGAYRPPNPTLPKSGGRTPLQNLQGDKTPPGHDDWHLRKK